jgi:hypothetical protein
MERRPTLNMTAAVLIFAGFGLGVCTMAAIERHRRAIVIWLFRVTRQQMPATGVFATSRQSRDP